MHSFVRAATLAALLALAAAASARRSDQDFEFDDDAEPGVTAVASGAHSRRPRRYVYDPHNSLCRSLVCKKREVCVLRDAFTALCASKKDILRRGDILVAASGGGAWEGSAREGGEWERDDADDDVFYDAGARDEPAPDADDAKRCVGCPGRARAQFLCGSDNRTYSSLCRLDLHNCVRRGARPVRLACRGFCPCARARRRPRPHPRPIHSDADWRRRKSESSHNEVLPERQSRRRLAQGSEGCALDKMANRLLDWFSVLMDEAGATAPPADGFPADCKPEVRWMFAHLDSDGDGLLSAANLYALRHDERERCLRPFLASCGGGGGVARAAWCGCLRRAARPCTALARAHPAAAASGAYVPACDARGYYRPRQCHAALAVCWCVDAHGQELPGSRTKGAPACPGTYRHRDRAAAYVPACDARGYYRPRQCHAALAVCWCVDAHGQELPGSRTKGAPACPGTYRHRDRAAAYVPACDARGYYRPRQCHAALAVCWCVDAHGQELPGSRTKGAPACPGTYRHRDRAAAYVPACDARGYYRPRQCHAALAVCWCVDAHGQELPGSRTKGAPACPGTYRHRDRAAAYVPACDARGYYRPRQCHAALAVCWCVDAHGDKSSEGAEGAPADDEDGGGSGDAELRF